MVYVDTSVLVALFAPEAGTDGIRDWFAGLRDPAVSSDWLRVEFASAISIKTRTGQLAEPDAKAIRKEFNLLADGGIRLAPISRTICHLAAEMAGQYKHGLRGGDALHLATAREMGATAVATLDNAMAGNARRLKMGVVEFA